MSMTLAELCDWHARRDGWNPPGTMPERTGDFSVDSAREHMARGAWWKIVGNDFQRSSEHPFPATLDGAASALPMGWEWRRKVAPHDVERWEAYRCMPDCYVELIGNGKEIEDRYTLAMLAWQQEAAR